MSSFLVSPAAHFPCMLSQSTLQSTNNTSGSYKKDNSWLFFPGPPQGKNIHINPHFRPPPGGRGMPEGKELGSQWQLLREFVQILLSKMDLSIFTSTQCDKYPLCDSEKTQRVNKSWDPQGIRLQDCQILSMDGYTSEDMKDHIFELCRTMWRHRWSMQLYTQVNHLWNLCLKK